MANVAFDPAARIEYQTAVAWYQHRDRTVARRFVDEVNRIVAQIGARPNRFGWYDDEFR